MFNQPIFGPFTVLPANAWHPNSLQILTFFSLLDLQNSRMVAAIWKHFTKDPTRPTATYVVSQSAVGVVPPVG
jgi:hypothetical protein